jgi:hypothetical protein
MFYVPCSCGMFSVGLVSLMISFVNSEQRMRIPGPSRAQIFESSSIYSCFAPILAGHVHVGDSGFVGVVCDHSHFVLKIRLIDVRTTTMIGTTGAAG